MKNLVYNLILNLGSKGVSVIANLAFNIYAARILGANSYGEFIFIFSISMGFAVYSQWGMQVGLMQYLSKAYGKKEIGKESIILKKSFKIVSKKLFYTIPVYLLLGGILIYYNKISSIIILLGFCGWFVSQTYLFMIYAWLRSNDRAYFASFLEQGLTSLITIILILSYSFFWSISLETIVIFFSASNLLITLFFGKEPFLKIINNKEQDQVWEEDIEIRSKTFFAQNFSNYLLNWTGIWVTGLLLISTEVALISASQKIAQGIVLSLTAFNGVIAPRFGRLYSANKIVELENLAKKSSWLLLIIISPLIIVFIYYGKEILTIFGEGFSEGYIYLMIIMVGQVVNAACGSSGYLLAMSGNESILKNIVIFSGVTSVILALLLTWMYGGIGAAISISAGISINNLLVIFYIHKKFNFIMIPGLQWIK